MKKAIKIKGPKLQIVYAVKESKEKIILKGKIQCDVVPSTVEKMMMNGDDELVVTPMNEEISLNDAEALIKNLLKL